MESGVAAEKLLSPDFTSEIRLQVIESSLAVDAGIRGNYSFGFFSTAAGHSTQDRARWGQVPGR
jgi:hypothetical protein